MPEKIIIVTVGWVCEPIVNAIQNYQPEHIVFICTDGDKGSQIQVIGEGTPCQGKVEKLPNILTQVKSKLPSITHELRLIQNTDDLVECYQAAAESIRMVQKSHPDSSIYADFTGGTKIMGLALAIAALDHNIPIQSSNPFSGATQDEVSQARLRLQRQMILSASPKTLSNKAKPATYNSLTALRVGNFKAFADQQYIPLRPLTLIFGANSSGKSSIIHSLLLAHHAIKNGELDIYRTEAGGDSVDLGGFGQYVHKRDRRSQVEWSVDIDPKQLSTVDRGLVDLLQPIKKLTVGVGIGTRLGKGRVRVRSFFIEADDRRVLNMSSRPKGKLQLDRLDSQHPILSNLIQAILEANTFTLKVNPEDREEIEKAIYELVPEITARVSRLLPTKIQVGDDGDISIPKINPKPGQQEDLADTVRLILPYRLSELIGVITETVERDIGKLRYLGPFRTYPPRHFAFSRQQDANWYAGGGYAWDILLNNAEVRQKVNAWLGDSDRMKSPYELVVRSLLPDSQLAVELYPRIAKSLHDLTTKLIFHAAGFGSDIQQEIERLRGDFEAAGIDLNSDNVLPEVEQLVSMLTDTDSLSETWVQEMTSGGDRISDLVLIDKRTKTPVSHRDVGIGISQVIPILVSCYGLSDALVAIEQPEIHLHPRLQAELGSVFAESIKPPYNNRFILETHSEHLMLRLQKLIREGNLSPEDVSVIYVDCDSEGSQCLELRLDEEGDFIDEWPDGFFEDDFREIFS
ncbi:MAG: DUF3696 domain-containing protein [Nostoc sp. ChiSLP02]|nr:DUF3696 domain-containing protein [Nostoc sp. DedSLP05]MDZ8098306.1 DUF3696 domain-containing protein [Nostoc sp. DedSLP01]MDZ8185780.1 DUF3696 domain-containing protein [Nostoc sp. ChiSLP02]